MSGASMGRRRRRVYKRKFDWAEARARYAAGELGTTLAKEYGVNKEAVYRVLRLPEYLVRAATVDDMAVIGRFSPNHDECPRCLRPKLKRSQLCRDCHSEERELAPTTLERVPGSPSEVLADVPPGRIVRYQGRWGVVVRGAYRDGYKVVDFWDAGREHVKDIAIVAVAPALRVFVGGVEEEDEEIAA